MEPPSRETKEKSFCKELIGTSIGLVASIARSEKEQLILKHCKVDVWHAPHIDFLFSEVYEFGAVLSAKGETMTSVG